MYIFALLKSMKTLTHISALQNQLELARKTSKTVGLVPTMGALHPGHLSLIEAAEKENDFIVVTIFVNPTQFNNRKDLEIYPRDMEKDLLMLADYKVDIVFAPDVEEMYPSEEKRVFDLHPLDSVMEGKFRPGHFAGVAEIVSKLFEITSPDNAYFGLKDFQQLSIIRKLTELMGIDINIIGCPIIREDDGLAMSSRNQLLSKTERDAAPHIYKTLLAAKTFKGKRSPAEISDYVKKEINAHPLMELEYFEIVDDKELTTVSSWDSDGNKVGCIAVHLGAVRLIDNIYFH